MAIRRPPDELWPAEDEPSADVDALDELPAVGSLSRPPLTRSRVFARGGLDGLTAIARARAGHPEDASGRSGGRAVPPVARPRSRTRVHPRGATALPARPPLRMTADLVAHAKEHRGLGLASTGYWKRQLGGQEDPSGLLDCDVHNDELFAVRVVEAWEAGFTAHLHTPTHQDFAGLGPSSVIVSVVAREDGERRTLDLRDRVTLLTGREAPARLVDEPTVQSFVLPVDSDGRVELAVATPMGPTRLVLEFKRPPARQAASPLR